MDVRFPIFFSLFFLPRSSFHGSFGMCLRRASYYGLARLHYRNGKHITCGCVFDNIVLCVRCVALKVSASFSVLFRLSVNGLSVERIFFSVARFESCARCARFAFATEYEDLLTVQCHKQNNRFPNEWQRVRIHGKVPFFCFSFPYFV